jgi:hypothetical protein
MPEAIPTGDRVRWLSLDPSFHRQQSMARWATRLCLRPPEHLREILFWRLPLADIPQQLEQVQNEQIKRVG